jgi:hypothetical protein
MQKQLRYPIIIRPSGLNAVVDCPDLKLHFNLTGHPPVSTIKANFANAIQQEIQARNRKRQKIPMPSTIYDIEAQLPANSSNFVLAIECEDRHHKGVFERLAQYGAYPLQIIDSFFDAFTSFLALSIASKNRGHTLPILGIIVLFLMDMLIFIGIDAPGKLQSIGKYVDDLCRSEAVIQTNRTQTSFREKSLTMLPYLMLHTLASAAAFVYAITNYHSLIALAHKGNTEGTKPDWLSDEILFVLAIISASFALISNFINANSVAHESAKQCTRPFHAISKRRNSEENYSELESPSQ